MVSSSKSKFSVNNLITLKPKLMKSLEQFKNLDHVLFVLLDETKVCCILTLKPTKLVVLKEIAEKRN